MRMRLLLWAVSVLVAAGAAAGAEERILDFHSDITVHKDGSLVVCETIKVHAEGDQIKRGIYRDFPTMYKGKYFTRRWVPFDVVSVLRDGKVDAYHTQGLDNGVRVYIGQENKEETIRDYSVVLGSYGLPNEARGTLGVIGPTRMNYEKTIAAVRYLSLVMSALVAELYGREPGTTDSGN